MDQLSLRSYLQGFWQPLEQRKPVHNVGDALLVFLADSSAIKMDFVIELPLSYQS